MSDESCLTTNIIVQFFYFENRKMCLSKMILYQYFVFCPAWESFSSGNILYIMCKTFHLFYFLCLYKTVTFDIIIKKFSFIFLRSDLFDPHVCIFLQFFFSHGESKWKTFVMKKFVTL